MAAARNDSERKILALTCVAHFLTHLYELTFPALALTVRDDFGWTLGEVLRLSFLMYLLFGLGALPMGLLSDHWKARHVMTLGMFGGGLGALWVARADTQAEFVAALACVGLATSAYHPAGMALLSRHMRQRGRALGINGVFGNLGSAAAPFVAGILAFQFGWRIAYAVLGAVGIVAGLWALSVRVDESRATGALPHAAVGGGRRSPLVYFAILCVAMTMAGFSYRGVSLVLPATFRDQTTFLLALLQRLDASALPAIANLAAAVLASFVYSVGMLGQVVGGHLADRHDLRKLYLAFHAASLPFLFAMAFLSETLLVVAAALYVFFSLGMQPIENSLVARFTPERWRSTSYGIKFILNFGVGSFAVYGVSALQGARGFAGVYLALCVVVVLLCAAAVFLLYTSRGVRVANQPIPELVS